MQTTAEGCDERGGSDQATSSEYRLRTLSFFGGELKKTDRRDVTTAANILHMYYNNHYAMRPSMAIGHGYQAKVVAPAYIYACLSKL